MKKQHLSILLAAISLLILTGLSATPVNAQASPGAVYIMTNNPASNGVIVYTRAPDGSLAWSGDFATNGLGASGLTGSNQGGLVLSQNGRTLLVVNAGSNDISAFRVNHDGLTLTDKVDSNGAMPVSLAIHGNWVYVVDTGGASKTGNIAGFYLSHSSEFSAIPGSVQSLSGVTAPAQISFNPTGTELVVTEKSTSLIDTYNVDTQGVATGPITHPSSGITPFGFAFDRAGHLIVSEAAGGPSGTSAVSSYALSSSGALTTISASIPDTQMAACWLVVTGNSKFAYTTNAHSGTISSYTIASDGSVSLLHSVAVTTGPGDLDMALSRNSRYLYVANSGAHAIQAFKVDSDGGLTLIGTTSEVPAGADGLAAN